MDVKNEVDFSKVIKTNRSQLKAEPNGGAIAKYLNIVFGNRTSIFFFFFFL